MMNAFGMARLGRDVELRYTNNGDAVCNLSLAFGYGRKDETGLRPTAWVDASLWGKRAEALAPYLVKGLSVTVVLEDLHMEVYQSPNGEGHKLAARVLDIDLGSTPRREETEAPYERERFAERPVARASAPAPAPRRPVPAAGRVAPAPRRPVPPSYVDGGSGFDDLDDDVPF